MIVDKNRHASQDGESRSKGTTSRIIRDYEQSSDDAIAAELAAYSIDPQKTIDAVTEIVRAEMARWQPVGAGKD